MHTVIDEHSRVVHAEIRSGEAVGAAVAVVNWAVSWFAGRDVTVERVLSTNDSAYK